MFQVDFTDQILAVVCVQHGDSQDALVCFSHPLSGIFNFILFLGTAPVLLWECSHHGKIVPICIKRNKLL